MKTQQLKTEMDEWVKHFNHEITTMNKYLVTIAQSSKEIRRIDLNQRNDLSDILYMKEVIHRHEKEISDLRMENNTLKLIQIIGLKQRQQEQTLPHQR